MIALDRYILGFFDIIHGFQYCQAVAHAVDSHGFEIVMLKSHQSLAHNLVFLSKNISGDIPS